MLKDNPDKESTITYEEDTCLFSHRTLEPVKGDFTGPSLDDPLCDESYERVHDNSGNKAKGKRVGGSRSQQDGYHQRYPGRIEKRGPPHRSHIDQDDVGA